MFKTHFNTAQMLVDSISGRKITVFQVSTNPKIFQTNECVVRRRTPATVPLERANFIHIEGALRKTAICGRLLFLFYVLKNYETIKS